MATLVNGPMEAGELQIQLEGRADNGQWRLQEFNSIALGLVITLIPGRCGC